MLHQSKLIICAKYCVLSILLYIYIYIIFFSTLKECFSLSQFRFCFFIFYNSIVGEEEFESWMFLLETSKDAN